MHHRLSSQFSTYHRSISLGHRASPTRLILIAMLLSSTLTASSLGVAHPHSLYAATDEAVSRPLDLSNLRSPPVHNARLRYRLILTESQTFPEYEEFYVCLRDVPPGSQQLLAYCVSAFGTATHQVEGALGHEDLQPLLLPQEAVHNLLEEANLRDLALTDMAETSLDQPSAFEVPYGKYYEQERNIRYATYPYSSPDLDGVLKLSPHRRFGFQPLGDPIHIAAILYNWLVFERSYLPVRIPILLPALAKFLLTTGLKLAAEDSSLYHCLITFEPRQWEPDRLLKSCLPSFKSWHSPGETVYSSEITHTADKDAIISLDHLLP